MPNENKALAAYEEKAAKIAAQLESLQRFVSGYMDRDPASIVWGHVARLNRAEEKLTELSSFLRDY